MEDSAHIRINHADEPMVVAFRTLEAGIPFLLECDPDSGIMIRTDDPINESSAFHLVSGRLHMMKPETLVCVLTLDICVTRN